MRRIATLSPVVSLIPRLTMADQVTLRSGRQYRGTVADRSLFRSQVAKFDVPPILPAEGDSAPNSLVRIAREDIDYAVLEDGQQHTVFDVARIANAPASSVPMYGASSSKAAGIVAVVLGAGIFAAGAIYKPGDARAVVTQHSIQVDDKTYDAGNYLRWGIVGQRGDIRIRTWSAAVFHGSGASGSAQAKRRAWRYAHWSA